MLRELTLAGACLAMLGTCAQNMVAGEYWVDVDPGWGQGNAIAGLSQPDIAGLQFQVAINGLSEGLHIVGIRTKDANGRWSRTNTVPVRIEAPDVNAAIVHTEYFLNTDPGWGEGLASNVQGPAEVPPTITSADISTGTSGMNTLFFRTKDAHGHWSLTQRVPLYLEEVPSGSIISAESFWDVDPGFGQGTALPDWTPGADILGTFNVAVPIDIGEGYHQLFVRTMDTHAHWGLTNHRYETVEVHGTVDVNDLTALTGITTYPNPFIDGITVRTDDGQPLRVVLYDPQGKLVHDKLLTGTTHIDLAHHASGAFTAFFWKDRERIHRTTLIKQ